MSTFLNEKSLPHLPVPTLTSTAGQLIDALSPLVTSEELLTLKEDSKEFITNPLISLIQRHLITASQNPDHSCYLNSINDEVNPGIYGELNNDILPRNPYLVLEEDPYLQTINPPNQAQRASSLINSSLKFILSLRNETLKPDVTPKNGNPLTMNCYKNLFGTSRIPAENHVTIKRFDQNDSNHIMIICNNQYYKLEVIKSNQRVDDDDVDASSFSGNIWFNNHDLSLVLEEIVTEATKIDTIESVNSSIGSITTQTFKVWKQAREELQNSNRELLETIDLSLFVVVLDSVNSPETDQEKTSVISHGLSNLLHGTNIQTGSCTSRWYDKLQLIVTRNSVAGVVWELALMDSTAILRYISDIYTDLILKLAKDINGAEYTLFDLNVTKFVSSKDNEKKPVPKKLEVHRTPELLHLIHLLETRLADLIHQHEYKMLTIKLDGHLVSKFNLSVDLVLQVCLQITNYTLYGKLVNTLEPITTRKFRDARTELVPVQSEAVAQCCKTFISNDDIQVKWKRFRECCDAHSRQYLDAMQGRGFERHFLSLVHCIRSSEAVDFLNELNKDVDGLPQIPQFHHEGGSSAAGLIPPLLANPCIDKLSSPELLILNCGNPALHLFGITPAIDQGFGIGYIIHADRVIVTVSSKHRQTDRFLATFKHVVHEVKSILHQQDNLLYTTADTEARKNELEQLRREKDNGSDSLPPKRKGSTSRGQAIPLTIASNPIPYSPHGTSPTSTLSDDVKQGDDYDVFGGYGYFDFGELDHRSDILSHNSSYMNSEISISLNSASTSTSRLQSRHHSSTNLHKMAGGPEDLKQKISLSESIRDRLQSTESFHSSIEPEVEHKPRSQIGRALDMSWFKR